MRVVAGATSTLTSVSSQTSQSSAKRLEVVDGAGHLNLYEKPDRFIAFMYEVRASLA